jgi:general secretion pathway protein C
MNLRDLQALTAQQWAARANSVLPYAVSAGLVIAIAWQLVQVTWLFLDRDRGASAPVLAQAPRPRTPAPAAVDVQAIANAHIFDVANVAQTLDPMEAPPAQVNLVLAGTMASDPPDQAGFAIIGETPTNAKTFAVGATIQPGIRLHAVYADRVIIDRGGSLETLKLPRQFVGAPPTPAVAALAPAPAPAPTNFAQNLRRIAETNPSAFSEIVRPQPVFANGNLKGYRVYPGRNRKPFARLGLQPGDLVTSINGTPLDDPARGMEIFNSISSSPRVEVTVERNGQSQQVVLDTAKINLPDAEGPARGAASAPTGGAVQPPAPAPADTSRSVAGIETD